MDGASIIAMPTPTRQERQSLQSEERHVARCPSRDECTAARFSSVCRRVLAATTLSLSLAGHGSHAAMPLLPLTVTMQRDVELRVLPNLWSLRDAVVESTPEFSIIRWCSGVIPCAPDFSAAA